MHISPDDKRLQYCGRIDFDNPKAPVLVYAASFVQIRFTGTQISVTLENKRAYWSRSILLHFPVSPPRIAQSIYK